MNDVYILKPTEIYIDTHPDYSCDDYLFCTDQMIATMGDDASDTNNGMCLIELSTGQLWDNELHNPQTRYKRVTESFSDLLRKVARL